MYLTSKQQALMIKGDGGSLATGELARNVELSLYIDSSNSTIWNEGRVPVDMAETGKHQQVQGTH